MSPSIALTMLSVRPSLSAFLRFVPPCPIRQWTGLQCPGCGGTRCLLALLHGDLTSAWRSNALLTLLLPAAALLLTLHLVAAARHTRSAAADLLASRRTLHALAAVTLAFTLARNLL